MTISATELFAMSQSAQCKGTFRCYWCASPCTHQFLAPQPTPEWRVKNKLAKMPGSSYICVGCWLFQRPSVTAMFLTETNFKDRQTLKNYSLWITGSKTRTISKDTDTSILYEMLLTPPLTFCMSLIDGKYENKLQFAYVNQHESISANTELFFTINDVKYSYTPYELEIGLSDPKATKAGGVLALIKMFGEYKELKKKVNDVGRPTSQTLNKPKEVVRIQKLTKR